MQNCRTHILTMEQLAERRRKDSPWRAAHVLAGVVVCLSSNGRAAVFPRTIEPQITEVRHTPDQPRGGGLGKVTGRYARALAAAPVPLPYQMVHSRTDFAHP